jgi:hypothetical protein
MAGKIDEQGVYPILDINKNDNPEGSNSHQQNASRVRSKEDGSNIIAPPGASYQQGPGYPSGFHSNEMFDQSKGMSMNSRPSIDTAMLTTPRNSLDVVSSLLGATRQSLDMNSQRPSMDGTNVQQRSLLDPNKLNQQDANKMNMAQQNQPTGMPSTTQTSNSSSTGAAPTNPNNFTYDERFHVLYEREIRWTEVRRYSEFIRRFATELSHLDITKENFYDLYNMALCLLKSVDGLDPDKIARKLEQPQYAYMQSQMPGQQGAGGMVAAPMQQGQMSDIEMAQRKNFEYAMGNRAAGSAFDGSAYISPIPKYGIPTGGDAVYYNQSGSEGVVPVGTYALPLGASPAQFGGPFMKTNDPLKPKNFTGELTPTVQRRRRTIYTSRRNLHCHMCGVTETPEWRRGPAGDHTLCNACGLHYAKSLKKQRKERDSRKHSIDMLLNENQQSQNNGENPATPTSPNSTPPTNNNTPSNITAPPPGAAVTPTPEPMT